MWHDPWAAGAHTLRAAGAEVKIRNPNDYVQVGDKPDVSRSWELWEQYS